MRRAHFQHAVHQGGNWKDFENEGATYLFVVYPAGYGLSTFLTFGIHGRSFTALRRLPPLITMPRAFFFVLGLTDILQYFGGIAHSKDAIEQALQRHQSVVWCPTGPMDHSSYFGGGDGNECGQRHLEEAHLNEDDIFVLISEHGKRCNLYIVPVVHVGEDAIYTNRTQNAVPGMFRCIQKFCWERFQYEFPLVLSGWYGTIIPKPCRLTTIVGAPISTTTIMLPNQTGKRIQKTPAILKQEFLSKYNDIRAMITNLQQQQQQMTITE